MEQKLRFWQVFGWFLAGWLYWETFFWPIMSNFWELFFHVFMGEIFFSRNIVVSAQKSCNEWKWKKVKKEWILNRLRNIGILLPKLFWPTVKKKLLKFEGEGREFAKCLRSLEHRFQTVIGQTNFLNRMLF